MRSQGGLRRAWRAICGATMAMTIGTGPVCAAPRAYVLDPSGTAVSFFGRATLHAFSGMSRSVQGTLAFDPDPQRLIVPASVAIPIASLTTGIAARDRQMRAMFDAPRAPLIQFTLTVLTRLGDDPSAPGAARYRLEGTLRLRAAVHPLAFDAVAHPTADEGWEVSGDVPLSLKGLGLKPPSLLGLFRVHDAVLVRFTSRWRRLP